MDLKLPRKLFYFIVFGCLGITTEIFFTAGSDLVFGIIEKTGVDLKLQGKSYIWMFPIYGSAAIFLPIFMDWLLKLPLAARLVIYVVGIFTIEFITGWLLDVTTGQCPWHYDSKLSVMGYIHLGFTPFWMLFGFILETVYRFLESIDSPFVKAKTS